MTRFAVGPSWSKLTPAEQQELVRAFSRMTVATYAHNFDSYNNQKFELQNVDTRGPDKLVHTVLAGGNDKTNLIYRMRQSGGTWKVISGIPCSINAFIGAPSSVPSQSRSPLAMASPTGGNAATTALTASVARPS